MSTSNGTEHFKARARLALILGEQLITDEISAVSELIKNSYDADATKVTISLKDVSKEGQGIIQIIDNGNGMTRNILLSSWLELGAISKARSVDEPPRVSEIKKRSYLGEKGLGRLAIHKLGKKTELTTRRIKELVEIEKTELSVPRVNEAVETKLTIDWSQFEDKDKFIGDVDVYWEEKPPSVFKKDSILKYENGTQLIITNLHRKWSQRMMKELQRYVWYVRSPFSPLSDFDVELEIDDPEKPEMRYEKLKDLLDTCHYTFEADVKNDGFANIEYSFNSKGLYPEFDRKMEPFKKDLKNPEDFPEEKTPSCGPFKFHLYCWDLGAAEKKAAFEDTAIYTEMIKPITGVKLFREGFRVLPYGDEAPSAANLPAKLRL